MPEITPNTHVILGPGRALSSLLSSGGIARLNEFEIHHTSQFKRFLSFGITPEFAVAWGFLDADLDSLVRQWAASKGVRLAYGELGWFPHYESFHLDPEGFCWDSLLARTRYAAEGFRPFPSPDPDLTALRTRAAAKQRGTFDCLPSMIKPPYVLWPCQMVSDKVNLHGVNAKDWCRHVAHFRSILPMDVQLVVRPHPKAHQRPSTEKVPYYRLANLVAKLPNTELCAEGEMDLLVANAEAVTGMNSTALYEAAMIHGKPAFAFSRSWFDYKPEIVTHLDALDNTPVSLDPPDEDACHWLYRQFMDRQIIRHPEPANKSLIRLWLDRWAAVPGYAIPATAHFIWIGDREMPALYLKNLEEFQALNPAVDVILHSDESAQSMPLHLVELYAKCPYPQQKADILRAWLLAHRGGMYFDMDFAWIRPLPASLFTQGAWCGSNHRTPYENGEMGCPVASPAMLDYLGQIELLGDKELNHPACFGPRLLRRVIESGAGIKQMPWWWFNPLRGQKDQYYALLESPPAERQATLAQPGSDGQMPVAQHLHGSINNQFQYYPVEESPLG